VRGEATQTAPSVGIHLLVERRPGAAAGEPTAGRDSEGRQPVRERLGDDERAAVRGDDRAVREGEVVGRGLDAAVGMHEREHGGPERLAGLVVVAEVADVGSTRGVDDHVVAVEGGEAGEIGVHDETAALETEEPPVHHRDDQQAAVGEPAETRGLRPHLDDQLDDAVGRHGDDALAVHVGDPEAAVVPARPLEEVEAVGHHAKVGGHAAFNKHLAHIRCKPGWGAPTALTAVARAAVTGAGG